MEKLLAQGLIIQPTSLPGQPTVPPVNIQGPLVGINNLGDIINLSLKFLLPLAAVVLFFVIVYGGDGPFVSPGEPGKNKDGRNKITTGIIGFVLLVLSYVIVKLIAWIFGLGGGII